MPQMPDPAVVVRNVFDQPVDRVVGVAALVESAAALAGWGRTSTNVALRHEAPAHVLIDEDEPLAARTSPTARGRPVDVDPVGPDAVGRAGQHDRVRA